MNFFWLIEYSGFSFVIESMTSERIIHKGRGCDLGKKLAQYLPFALVLGQLTIQPTLVLVA